MRLFRQSDYLYLLITNALLKNGNARDKFMFLKRNIYSKGAGYSIAKAVISSSYSDDECEMFMNVVKKMYEHNLITVRKKQELMHIIELKYGIPSTENTVKLEEKQYTVQLK